MAGPWERYQEQPSAPAPAAAPASGPWARYAAAEEPALEIDIVGGTPVAADKLTKDIGSHDQVNPEVRGLGLGARSVMQGAGSLLGAIGGDAFNAYVMPGEQPSYRDAASALADRIGLPAPQNARERVLGDVGEATTGTALTMGGGSLLTNAAPPVASFLTAQPRLQAVSTATGAGASSATREQGGSAGEQLAAGLVGGLTPGALSTTTAATMRGLVRGRDGAAMQQNINNFASVGATPSVGQASQNWLVQGAENLLAGGPTSAGVMNRFAERQADNIGDGLQRLGTNLARNASGERAGRAIKRGIHGPDGFTARYKQTQEQLFDRLDDYIPQDKPILVSNTTSALGELNAPIPGAPNVSRFFQNERIQGIGNALGRDLAQPTDASRALDDALGRIDQLYASRDSAMQDMGRFASFANEQAIGAHQFYPVTGAPRIPGRYAPHTQRAAEGRSAAEDAGMVAMGNVSRAQVIEGTLDQLRAAVAATDGRLPYEAIKKLRTLVGREIDNAGLMSDFPRDKWKALYGALSRDLEGAAAEAGPGAVQAFSRANNYTRFGMNRVESIQQVIDKNGGPERIFEAALSGTKDGGSTLRAVMQSVPKEAQKQVTAAVIRRMGMANPGAQDATGEAFSAATFLTNWNKVSPEAKRALFDRHGPQFSRDMDRIARVAENIKQGGKVFANPSGTANRTAAISYGAALVGSILSGNIPTAAGVVATGAMANGAARYLTNPNAVRWLARVTPMPRGALVSAIGEIRNQAGRTNDEDLSALADDLEQAVNRQPQAGQQ